MDGGCEKDEDRGATVSELEEGIEVDAVDGGSSWQSQIEEQPRTVASSSSGLGLWMLLSVRWRPTLFEDSAHASIYYRPATATAMIVALRLI